MKEKLDKALECFKKKDWNGAIDSFTSIIEVEHPMQLWMMVQN